MYNSGGPRPRVTTVTEDPLFKPACGATPNGRPEMVTWTGTEAHIATLVQDFLREQMEATTLCRDAERALDATTAHELVADLVKVHEDELSELRALAAQVGVELPERGTLHEARSLGRLRRAGRRGGDDGILAVVHDVEDRLGAAYDRALTNTVLPDTFRPLFEAASQTLRRHRERLDAVERVAR